MILGGIAKGWALDRMAAELRADGFATGLLSFGQSSVQALGTPPGDTGWRLLLTAPVEGFAGVVELSDRAFSVSSSLGQWSEIAGRRYGHVVDPRSGRALERRRQAAVVAASATLAEVLSTALVVLTPEAGLSVVEAQDAEAFIIEEDGTTHESSGWRAASGFQPLASAR